MGKQVKFSWLELSVKLTLEDLQMYVNSMETHLEERKNELTQSFNNQSSGMNQDEKNELYEYMFLDENQSISKTYPDILRKSHIVSVYSYIEQELFNICNVIERYNTFPIKLKDIDIRHKGIIRAKYYLQNVLGLQVFNKNVWAKIEDLNKVRNHIIHEGKRTVSSNSAVYKSMKKYNSIKLSPSFTNERTRTKYYQYELSKKYSDGIIMDTQNFFMEILSEINTLKNVNLV